MKIGVLVKTVPDTEAKIKISGDGRAIETQGIKYVMNPFDEFAVEEALKIKEKLGDDSTVTVISLGEERSVETLRTALAMGADDAVLASDPAFKDGDSIAVAKVLAKLLSQYSFDLILCGKQGIDLDAAQTPAAVAEFLSMPQACVIVDLELNAENKSLKVKRRIEGADEVLEVKLPAVITCEKGLNEPRYASLPGIMKAKKKEIKKASLAELALSPEGVGSAGSKTEILGYKPLPERPPCKMLSGETAEIASDLVKALREEAKVI